MSRDGAPQGGAVPILSVRGLALRVGDKLLVQSLDLDVLPGQRWCVLGPNGSGKTTLLHALAGLRRPEAGAVWLDAKSYASQGPRAAARRRALLLQQRRFAFGMSVRECALLGRHPHVGRFDRPGQDDHTRVAAALAAMDLQALCDRDVLDLSGGEQQRTHLAAVLVQDPALFLLDEPTAHLDFKHQAALFSHLTELCVRDCRAVVFSTHELTLAARFATHAIVLADGGRVHLGTREALLQRELLSSVFGFPLVEVAGCAGKTFVPRW